MNSKINQPKTINVKPLLDLCLFLFADNPNYLFPQFPQDLYPKLYLAITKSTYWHNMTHCRVLVKNKTGKHHCNRKKPCFFHNKKSIEDKDRCNANNAKGERCKNESYPWKYCWAHNIKNKHVKCSETDCNKIVIQTRKNQIFSNLAGLPLCQEHKYKDPDKNKWMCQAITKAGKHCLLEKVNETDLFCSKHLFMETTCIYCSKKRKRGYVCKEHAERNRETYAELTRQKYYKKCKILKLNHKTN